MQFVLNIQLIPDRFKKNNESFWQEWKLLNSISSSVPLTPFISFIAYINQIIQKSSLGLKNESL